MELEERKVVSKLAHLSSWKKHVALQMGKTALRGGGVAGNVVNRIGNATLLARQMGQVAVQMGTVAAIVV